MSRRAMNFDHRHEDETKEDAQPNEEERGEDDAGIC